MLVQKQIEIDRITMTLGGAISMHPYSILIAIAQYLGRIRIRAMNEHLLHPDDESLMRLIQQGDHGAFTEMVNRHSKRFYGIAYRSLFNKHDAEDIVQEAFLKLWGKSDLWNPHREAKFTTWFYRIVVNLCLDYKRRKLTLPLAEDMESADRMDGQEEMLNEKQRQEMLDRFIRELPERQQMALNLCFYEGLSNQEAADIMGVHIKALQSLIVRAKTTLKKRVNHNSSLGI